ncbi:trypsin-like serine peptidase [Streptomyces sp. NPDC000878]
MAGRDVPRDKIRQRWEQSRGDELSVAAALRERNLDLANTQPEIDQRRERLSTYNIELEVIVDGDDSVWLSFFSRALTTARSVGRVVTCLPHEPITAEGTGVMISRRLLLTNNHVVPDSDLAASMGVQLGYDYDDEGDPVVSTDYQFAPEIFFFTVPKEDLDFTVVAIAEPLSEDRGFVRLIEQQGKILKAEPLNVIHHPGGERKKLGIRDNRLVSEDDQWLRYTSDTRRGSSGAPVLNDQWEMVALHHGGVEARDVQGREMSWNEGARVSRIVRKLQEAELSPKQRLLVKEALNEGAGK